MNGVRELAKHKPTSQQSPWFLPCLFRCEVSSWVGGDADNKQPCFQVFALTSQLWTMDWNCKLILTGAKHNTLNAKYSKYSKEQKRKTIQNMLGKVNFLLVQNKPVAVKNFPSEIKRSIH